MRAEPVAGEKISGEKEIEASAIEAAMPIGVAGKMDDAEAAPIG